MSKHTRKLRFASQAIHAGERGPKPDFYPTTTPIHPSSTFYYDTVEDMDAVFGDARAGYVYTRYANPTVAALEDAITILEEGKGSVAFASGMAAIHGALLATGVVAGDTVLSSRDLYGATHNLFSNVFAALSVKFAFADFGDIQQYEVLLKEAKPKLVYLEALSNPLLRIPDVPKIIDLAHERGAQVLIDSTFATPYLLRPITLGADMVIHSATKYLGGHGDVTGGLLVCSTEEQRKAASMTARIVGGILGPFEAWITLRGIKTLPLRMQRHCTNALALARWMEKHPQIERVVYPGLASHPQHELARRLLQNDGFGGIVSFEIRGANKERVFKFLNALRLCGLATTMGDIYTQMLYPVMASHRNLPAPAQRKQGITESLVRVSVGIEDIDDIKDDIEQALA
jgi:cystathionine gamma-synthase/methionine-gamma-lyase